MKWRFSITTKMLSIVGLTLVAMAVCVGVSLVAFSQFTLAVQNIYEHGVVDMSVASRIALEVEVQRGLSGRAPAELNLELQEKYKADFGARSAAIDQNLANLRKAGLAPEQERLLHELQSAAAVFRAEAEHVFKFAGNFAQEDAVKVLQGSFAAADAQVKQVLEQLVMGTSEAARAQMLSISTSSQQTRNALLAISAGLILLVVGVCVTLARGITRALGTTLVAMHALAAGDLTKRLEVKRTDEVGELSRSFNTCIERFHQIIAEVKQQATDVATASRQLSMAAEEISSGAQQQASSLEETAASLVQITSTVQQNADNARQANQLAISSQDAAERGGQVVAASVAAMGEIDSASRKIADIVTTINAIAFPTNLLALNAAVEAARAGEQGRGFAVVATEVGSLAQRSATAAKEVKELIQDSVQKVVRGSELVYRPGQTLQEIIAAVKQVGDFVAEIAPASHEQSQGIARVNKAVTQMDQVVQQAASRTEELSSTAQGLAMQAQQLQGLVARFTLEQDVICLEQIPLSSRTAQTVSLEQTATTTVVPPHQNLPFVNEMTGKAICLSPTVAGKTHDRNAADEAYLASQAPATLDKATSF